MGRRLGLLLAIALMALLPVPAAADTHCTITKSTRLTADITDCGSGITIGADNVVLDGRGFSLIADDVGTGIAIDGRSNVTIKNLTITDFFSGAIRITDSKRIRIQGIMLDLPIGMASFGVLIEGSGAVSVLRSDLGVANGTNLIVNDSHRVRIRSNVIGGGGNQQVRITDSDRVSVTANRIAPGDNAFPMVELVNTDRSWFAGNKLDDEFVAGFQVDAASERNWFLRNATRGLGFVDESSGVGTAGTANRYRGNTCADTASGIPGDSDPDGLCEVEAPPPSK